MGTRSGVGRQRGVSRERRQQVGLDSRRMVALAQVEGQGVDAIQALLLRTFPGELAPGEARMYGQGWTVRTVRDGMQALATADGLDASGLQDADVWRWLRCEVFPRDSLERLCRLFRCHQAHLGWPPQGTEVPIDFTPEVGCSIASRSAAGLTAPPAMVRPPIDSVATAGGP